MLNVIHFDRSSTSRLYINLVFLERNSFNYTRQITLLLLCIYLYEFLYFFSVFYIIWKNTEKIQKYVTVTNISVITYIYISYSLCLRKYRLVLSYLFTVQNWSLSIISVHNKTVNEFFSIIKSS